MTQQSLVLVSFNCDQLQMVEHDGQPFVVMKPIVKALRLKWETQRIKLVENQKKFNYQVLICTPHRGGTDDQRREMGCIPLKKLNGWLFGINPNNIQNLIIMQGFQQLSLIDMELLIVYNMLSKCQNLFVRLQNGVNWLGDASNTLHLCEQV
jgi:hypothetical protein